MLLKDLVMSAHWLSVELMLLECYPDIENMMDEHKKVYEKLQIMQPQLNEMEIVLVDCEDHYDNEITNYVDVSGKRSDVLQSDSYALEFTAWEQWLGMKIALETIKNFTELEVIAHCLYEMTFIDYEQDLIKEQLGHLEDTASAHKQLTEKEKQEKTISLEELIEQLKLKGSS